jgi:hypothetical protein
VAAARNDAVDFCFPAYTPLHSPRTKLGVKLHATLAVCSECPGDSTATSASRAIWKTRSVRVLVPCLSGPFASSSVSVSPVADARGSLSGTTQPSANDSVPLPRLTDVDCCPPRRSQQPSKQSRVWQSLFIKPQTESLAQSRLSRVRCSI